MSAVTQSSACMCLLQPRTSLRLEQRALPAVSAGQVLLKVRACAVCRTDLHVVDGELSDPTLPIVPGHEIVGEVVARGADTPLAIGARVGVGWLGFSCGVCDFCRAGRENLCDRARFTGYHIDGGYAQHVLVDARFCYPLPAQLDDVHAAPLLCAGTIGYRCLRMTEDARRVGLYGFGAAAHLIAQVAAHEGREVYAFTRRDDVEGQQFALELGATWAGDSSMRPPVELDAAIIFAPVGALVPAALAAVRKAGIVVCGGIHMSDIPAFPYALLWGERVLRSVANLTRRDAIEFLALAARIPLQIRTRSYSLAQANEALNDLRSGRVAGAAVLVP
ncbi:MAG TPA: zinc-dependent alcohol dehydrogenase family protein [Steroidobacteraceae bacterium]|nr:zinc-dependent alcohol dehydrogenase family protein [Steroidobacteraceae bacterium]